jgi:hypothetical protein
MKADGFGNFTKYTEQTTVTHDQALSAECRTCCRSIMSHPLSQVRVLRSIKYHEVSQNLAKFPNVPKRSGMMRKEPQRSGYLDAQPLSTVPDISEGVCVGGGRGGHD